ncbi:hypothetical protein BHM03_00062561 [Ensete ventricosum]|uniref:Uncharacterized protein n=1 Tax=Ensete ventricosum TaxID=4639 RepID=A0A445MMV8_ENSVE|nr:hypothetical protein BHM03_00062561 [Ensete ventricosum]
MDSGASHEIISDLQNLSLHNNYGNNDDIIISDDKHILITHTVHSFFNHSFHFLTTMANHVPVLLLSFLCTQPQDH